MRKLTMRKLTMRSRVVCLVAMLLSMAASVNAQTRLAVFVVTFPTADPYRAETMTWMQDTLARVDQFYAEQSYEQFNLQSDSFGVYTLNLDHTATRQAIATAAKQAAIDAGVDLSPYTAFLYLSPVTDYVRAGYGDNSGAWIALTSYVAAPGYSMIAHELGHHLLGLNHAHGLRCTDANGHSVPMPFTRGSSCQFLEYGDDLDVMGQGTGHFNALTKPWLRAGGPFDIQTISVSGDYRLEPFETQTPGLKALKVVGSDWTYAVEYRQPIGFDVRQPWTSPANVFRGVIVHLALNGSELLSMNPPDPVSGLRRPALEVGQTFCDKAGRVSMTLLSADTAGAVVRVKIGHCK